MPFPSNPTPGQTHTEDNTTWVYAGPVNGWYRQSVNPGNSTTYTGSGGGGSATATGNAGEIQYTDGTNLAASNKLKWDSVNSELEVTGDVQLLDGGTYTTTLQTITPTANRTISLPDATGTVALVGGSSGQITFNSSGAYAGDSGLTYSATNKALTVGGATVTTSNPVINLSQTWNNGSTVFTGLFANFTATANANASRLIDLQANSKSAFAVFKQTNDFFSAGALNCGSAGVQLGVGASSLEFGFGYSDSNTCFISFASTRSVQFRNPSQSNGGTYIAGALGIGGTDYSTADCKLERDAANTLAQRNGTSAQVFRVYNTYTSSTNYELGKLEWNSNAFRIGTEKGSGGGTARTVEVHTDSIARLALDTTGSVRVVTGLTVATLPGTPAVGMVARVTDATAPAVGSTVAGGGAAAALVWYNGTNWTVIGV